MEALVAGFVIPMVIFSLFIAPLWLILHYRNKERIRSSLSVDERHELDSLVEHAGKLEERIETLEAILDDETPNWRKTRDSA